MVLDKRHYITGCNNATFSMVSCRGLYCVIVNRVLYCKKSIWGVSDMTASENGHREGTVKIILNSKNSIAVKEAIQKVSRAVMEKNKELYRRLAYK